MNLAFFVYDFTESTIALAKTLSKQHKVDYYYITSKGNTCISALGFDAEKTNKNGLQKLDKKELIFNYLNTNNIDFYLVVVPFGRGQLDSFNRIYLRRILKPKKYDAINVIGQRTILMEIHSIFKGSYRFHTIHEVNDHSKAKTKPMPILKQLVNRNIPMVFHSEITQKRFVNYFPEYENTTVIPMGTFDSYSIFRNGHVTQTNELKNTFLNYGYIHPYKGLKYFVEAIKIASKEVPDIQGIVAGTGSDDILDEIKNDKRFQLINQFITDKHLVELINSSKAVVCPYISASQSGIPLTTFVFNKPVIVSDLPGFTEVVENNKTGYIVPIGDTKEIAKCMINICKDNSISNEFAENIRHSKQTSEKLNWDKITAKTMVLIKK